MSEFQLTHIALVGARINSFRPYGYSTREALTMCRVVPETVPGPEAGDDATIQTLLGAQLPIWIHNIITDPGFPGRDRLLMSLRRFEGELRDKRDDEVVSTVLRYGFKNQQLDPLALPGSMPLQQRCAMVVHLNTWRDAYLQLSSDVVGILAANSGKLSEWCEMARQPEHAAVE
jgi:hypothetical protein